VTWLHGYVLATFLLSARELFVLMQVVAELGTISYYLLIQWFCPSKV
jgi:hypothetical protein